MSNRMRFHSLPSRLYVLATALIMSACAPDAGVSPAPAAHAAPSAPATLQSAPLASPASCTGAFVTYDLTHSTTAAGQATRLFDSNGAGLAVNDLDGDGLMDLVFANLSGPATILWNEGNLDFRREPITATYRTRGVATVDVDGDEALDIVFTGGSTTPLWLRNTGERTFKLSALSGVDRQAYAMNWLDLDVDGDLDLVTGSYDAGTMKELGPNYLFSAAAGINVYTHQGAKWAAQHLADEAEALAIALWDMDGDGKPDIWVANDFDMPDRVWVQDIAGWREIEPFERFSHSTMSLDRGDIDGDGHWDMFATDMKPYNRDVTTMATWLPLMQTGYRARTYSDMQRSENFLMVKSGHGFENRAYDRHVDATGWSWSGKFGDLDNDGRLDLYVVNGMIAADLLTYLQNHELVEENQALRNIGSGDFTPAPEWQLGSTRSGRGMSMADVDNDGDLDIVVNNLASSAQLFENQLCTSGNSIEVDLRMPGTANPYAIGATVALRTDKGTLMRDMRAISGYLSGDPARLHFGIPAGAKIEGLEVRWPDGAVSQVDAVPVHQLVTVTRTPPSP